MSRGPSPGRRWHGCSARSDRRTPCGRRDYAILLLLVTYGLRAREVAALTLDDIDWRRDRLAVPGRKAGHSTAFPLSAVAGEALVDYLRHGRPPSGDRHVFFRAVAPVRPISRVAVSACAKHYLVKAGIEVPRPGSHTLRHTCVQRLERRGVASDATFRVWREDDVAGDTGPGAAGRRSRRQSEPAGQYGHDRTVLRQMSGCCVHSRCIRRQDDAAKATKKRSDEGRCHYRLVVTLTHSAWLVIRSLPVSTGTSRSTWCRRSS